MILGGMLSIAIDGGFAGIWNSVIPQLSILRPPPALEAFPQKVPHANVGLVPRIDNTFDLFKNWPYGSNEDSTRGVRDVISIVEFTAVSGF